MQSTNASVEQPQHTFNPFSVSCPYCDYEPELSELICSVLKRDDFSYSVVYHLCKRCHAVQYVENTRKTLIWGYR